jgi:hypothetical protein
VRPHGLWFPCLFSFFILNVSAPFHPSLVRLLVRVTVGQGTCFDYVLGVSVWARDAIGLDASRVAASGTVGSFGDSLT